MNLRAEFAARTAAAKDLWKSALDLDPLEVAAVLTVGYLLLRGGGAWTFTLPLTVLCLAGFAIRPLLLNSSYWLVLAAVTAYANFRNWDSADNHEFLATYWCIALHCSLLTREPRESARDQARWMVGLSMAFACAWKFISPDFLNGAYFRYALLTDGRFAWMARVIAGVPTSSHNLNALRLAELRAFDATATSVTMLGGSRLAVTAQLMTWWTLSLEFLVAAGFLAPARLFVSRWKHALLIAFVFTTCAIANVVGFSWLLLVMGIAHTAPEARRTRGAYYASFLLLHVLLLPLRNFWAAA